jgi:ankyrin repeat protein
MPPKRKAQVSVVELQQEHSQDQESTNKRANSAKGKKKKQQQQQDPGLNVDCKQSMNLPRPPQSDDPIITQFKPVRGQWELNDENINRIDPRTGKTILHNYCQRINTTPLAVWRYLIETKGCDVNAQDKSKGTPISQAITYFRSTKDGGNITVLTYLLTQTNINISIKGWNGYSLLHYACDNINVFPIEIFKLLIETLGGDVNAQNDDDNTPLHQGLCAFSSNDGGDITVLMYLLSQKGENGNIKGKNGNTLLHYACDNINVFPIEIFKLLIETLGGDVNAQNDDNNTPIHCAFRYFYPNDSGDITVLMYLLSQKGINVNMKGQYDQTLLHYACGWINYLPLDVFKFLIETLGCDINVQDDDNNTPIHSALDQFDPDCGGDVTVLNYLLSQNGINGNIKDSNADTSQME